MALQNFLSRVSYDENTSISDKNIIEGVISSIYNSSTAMSKMELFTHLGKIITFGVDNGNEDSTSTDFNPVISLNFANYNEKSYIGDNGIVYFASKNQVILHELLHALTGDDDNRPNNYVTPNFDYVGSIVNLQRIISAELGWVDVRNSYEAVIFRNGMNEIGAEFGQSLTENNKVELVLSSNRPFQEINVSEKTAPVLIVGGALPEYITLGTGDDYGYAGAGSDYLVGGSGSDKLKGNSGSDTLIGGSVTPIMDVTNLDMTEDNTSLDDGNVDYLSGGEGVDRYYVYSTRVYSPFAEDEKVEDWASNELDLIDAKDADFQAYFQFKFRDEIKYVVVTAEDIANAEPVEEDETLLNTGVKVSFPNGEGTIEIDVIGKIMGTNLILMVPFPGGEERAVLGGLYDFLPGGQEPGNPGGSGGTGGPGSPGIPGQSTWLGRDDAFVAGATGATIIDVLANDQVPSGEQATIFVTRGTTNGSLQWNGTNLVYTPNQGFAGVDSFAYALVTSSGVLKTGSVNGNIIVGNANPVIGNEQNDTLAGDAGKNVLHGGKGSDHMIGGNGDDTYIYELGDGSDVVEETVEAGSRDVVQFGYGISAETLRVTRDANSASNIILVMPDGGKLTIKDGFDGLGTTVEEVHFADGTTWGMPELQAHYLSHAGTINGDLILGFEARNDVIVAGNGDDTVWGYGGNDIISGGAGNDVLTGGVGNDVIDGGEGDYDQANYEGFATDYAFTRNVDGTVTAIHASLGTDTLSNIDGLWFFDEFAWYNLNSLLTNAGSNSIWGTASGEFIQGTQAGDVIYGGDGNDTLYGGLGDDILKGEGGTYNQVDYDGSRDDYIFTLNNDGTTTVTNETYGTDILSNIDGIWFRGDSTWHSLTDLHENGWRGVADSILATAGEPVVLHLTANDTIPTGANAVHYIWAQPTHGTVYWNSAENSFVYVADAGYVGSDTLKYGLHDGDNGYAIMTPAGVVVNITVAAPELV